MKKIDLHIHTVPTVSDAPFSFDLNTMKRYVSEAALDAIAITNHNEFDRIQFAEIDGELDVVVFPGIEVTLDCGHVLIISDVANLDAFEEKTEQVSAKITSPKDSISIDELTDIFRNLDEHLVIPHYDKKPAIRRLWPTLRSCAGKNFAGDRRVGRHDPPRDSRWARDLHAAIDNPHLKTRATRPRRGGWSIRRLVYGRDCETMSNRSRPQAKKSGLGVGRKNREPSSKGTRWATRPIGQGVRPPPFAKGEGWGTPRNRQPASEDAGHPANACTSLQSIGQGSVPHPSRGPNAKGLLFFS